jgi:hypothetical protein
MTSIVTSTYRYKRPPRKRKPVAIEATAVVTAQPSTPREAAGVPATPPANDDRKPAIVTIKRKSRFGDAPDLTPEEHQRRGEAASAMWSRLVGRATAKDGKSAAVNSVVPAGLSSPATKSAIVTTSRKRGASSGCVKARTPGDHKLKVSRTRPAPTCRCGRCDGLLVCHHSA